LVPTLALLDPCGYKGLTRDLIHSLLKDYGCDLIFFFNYNRINMGITNTKVGKHMDALFGPAWLAELREEVPGLRPARRERIILRALRKVLREIGGEYVRHFRFLRPNGRTSHCLIFVTKEFKGVEIMREVMAGMSSRHVDDVASFTHDPRPVDESQPDLPDTSPGPLYSGLVTHAERRIAPRVRLTVGVMNEQNATNRRVARPTAGEEWPRK
jgi:hypothetical protein